MVTEKQENRLNVNNQRSFFGLIVAGVLAVLLIVITGFYWFFVKSPVKLATPIQQPGAAIFVSKVAPAMVSLLVNPEGLQSLEQEGEFSQIQNNLLANTQINFAKDIKPWLKNEITLAVTSDDIDHDSENGQNPGYLMVLSSNNVEESKEFVEVLFSQRALAGKKLEVEKYKGVKLLADTSELGTSEKVGNSLAAAVVGNFVLFANDIHVVKTAINNVQVASLNLSNSPEYQKAIPTLSHDSLGLAFFNLQKIAKWQGLELSETTYNSQLLGLELKPQGVLIESSFLTNSKIKPVSKPDSKPVGALQYIPESASLAIASRNLSNLNNSDLGKLWQQGTTTIYGSEQEAISRWLKPLVDVQNKWGLNLSEDIFSWVTGEYALAILPKSESLNPDWIFVVEKSPQLTQGIAKLDRIAENNGFNVSKITLKDQKITAWTELTTSPEPAKVEVTAKIEGAHTNLDNYEIFTSDLELMAKIITSEKNSLLENTDFKENIANLPQPNQGYVYIDWEKSQDFLEHQQPLLKFVEVLGKPLFDHLRSLTVSNYGEETGILKGGVFFHLIP